MSIHVDGLVAIIAIVSSAVLFIAYRGYPLRLTARNGDRDVTLETKPKDD